MKKFLLSILCAAAVLTSCEKELTAKISVDRTTVQTDFKGCVVEVAVSSNTQWSASCNFDDVVISKTSGIGDDIVSIRVPEYTGMLTKVIQVKFAASADNSKFTTSLSITQLALPFFICNDNEASIGALGGVVVFHVNANYDWSLVGTTCNGEYCTDLKVVPDSAAHSGSDVALQIPENNTGAPRTYRAILALDEHPDYKVVLIVNQSN